MYVMSGECAVEQNFNEGSSFCINFEQYQPTCVFCVLLLLVTVGSKHLRYKIS